MPHLRLLLLGAPQIELDGTLVETDRRKAVALLAYLAVTAETHTREALATLFWPEQDQSRALANLRRVIWELNRALGPGWLETGRQTVALKSGADYWLDVAAFETLLEGCQEESTSAGCLAALEEAIALYRGDFLAGFTLPDSAEFDDWQFFQAERLRAGLTRTLEELALGYERNGDDEAALPYARQWLALDPLDEVAHRQLMRLYAQMGQRAAAIRQYETCLRILEEELGVQPQAETRDLYERIASDQWPGSSSGVPAGVPHVPPVTLDNLPAQPTPFVDRDELGEALSLLAAPACRLLTLVGPGGSGKTRLSIEAATHFLRHDEGELAGGAWFVPLAPLQSADSIVTAIAGQLDFSFHREGDSPQHQLLDFLRPKRLLLVLDNFEHLIGDESLGLLVEIMAVAPGVKLLATSRTRLNAYGEQVLSIAGLGTPEADQLLSGEDSLARAITYGSVQLFRQSARQANPDFELTRDNLSPVIRICHMVEGLPLAIELAAAWSYILSPAEIELEIERSLDFLRTDLHGVPDRQRSIRAVFEASWRMLTNRERNAFRRLSVFRGGFTRPAGEVVSDESLSTLLSLTNKSWLRRGPDGRFQVHELLRQYANERLRETEGEWRSAMDGHSDFYTDLVQHAEVQMLGSQQKGAFDTVAQEFDNIWAAWLWHLDQGRLNRLAGKMLPGLFRFALARAMTDELTSLVERSRAEEEIAGESPGQNYRLAIWLTAGAYLKTVRTIAHRPLYPLPVEAVQSAWEIVSGFDDQKRLGPWLIYLLELYAWGINLEGSKQRLSELLPELRAGDDPWSLALALKVLGELSISLNALSEARIYLSEALKLYVGFGDELNRASILRQLAIVAYTEQKYQEAAELAQKAMEIFRAIGDQAGVGICLHELAEISLKTGQFDEAFRYYQERRYTYEKMGHWRLVFESLHWESMQALRYSNVEHVMRTRRQCLELCHDLGFELGIAWGEWELGEIYRVEGDYDTAGKHFHRAGELFEQIPLERGIAYYHRGLGEIAQALGEYIEARTHFQHYLEWSKSEPNYWNVAYALCGLGQAAAGLGRHQEAQQHFLEALEIAYETGASDVCQVALVGLADLSAKLGDKGKAIELATIVAENIVSWRETKQQAHELIATMRGELPLEKFEKAMQSSHSGDLATLVAKLLADPDYRDH